MAGLNEYDIYYNNLNNSGFVGDYTYSTPIPEGPPIPTPDSDMVQKTGPRNGLQRLNLRQPMAFDPSPVEIPNRPIPYVEIPTRGAELVRAAGNQARLLGYSGSDAGATVNRPAAPPRPGGIPVPSPAGQTGLMSVQPVPTAQNASALVPAQEGGVRIPFAQTNPTEKPVINGVEYERIHTPPNEQPSSTGSTSAKNLNNPIRSSLPPDSIKISGTTPDTVPVSRAPTPGEVTAAEAHSILEQNRVNPPPGQEALDKMRATEKVRRVPLQGIGNPTFQTPPPSPSVINPLTGVYIAADVIGSDSNKQNSEAAYALAQRGITPTPEAIKLYLTAASPEQPETIDQVKKKLDERLRLGIKNNKEPTETNESRFWDDVNAAPLHIMKKGAEWYNKMFGTIGSDTTPEQVNAMYRQMELEGKLPKNISDSGVRMVEPENIKNLLIADPTQNKPSVKPDPEMEARWSKLTAPNSNAIPPADDAQRKDLEMRRNGYSPVTQTFTSGDGSTPANIYYKTDAGKTRYEIPGAKGIGGGPGFVEFQGQRKGGGSFSVMPGLSDGEKRQYAEIIAREKFQRDQAVKQNAMADYVNRFMTPPAGMNEMDSRLWAQRQDGLKGLMALQASQEQNQAAAEISRQKSRQEQGRWEADHNQKNDQHNEDVKQKAAQIKLDNINKSAERDIQVQNRLAANQRSILSNYQSAVNSDPSYGDDGGWAKFTRLPIYNADNAKIAKKNGGTFASRPGFIKQVLPGGEEKEYPYSYLMEPNDGQ